MSCDIVIFLLTVFFLFLYVFVRTGNLFADQTPYIRKRLGNETETAKMVRVP